MSGSSEPNNEAETYKDCSSPLTCPASSPARGTDLSCAGSDSSEAGDLSDSSYGNVGGTIPVSPPSSPVTHGHKRSPYCSYKDNPAEAIPRQTQDTWKRRKLEAQAIHTFDVMSNNESDSGDSDAVNTFEDTRTEIACEDEETRRALDVTSPHSYFPNATVDDSCSNSQSSVNSTSDSDDILDVGGDGQGSEASEVSEYGGNGDCFDNENVLLYPECEKTRDEAISELLHIYLSNNLSKASLSDILKFYTSSLPSSHTMPTTTHNLLKYLDSLSVPMDEVGHFYCRPAMHSVDSRAGPCSVCASINIGVFYELPIESRIKFLFEHRGLADVIENYSDERRTPSNGVISDILDGSEYLRIWHGIVSKYKLTLILNVDGVSPYVSSSAKMWPLMFSIMEVPPHLRSSFTIVWGIWFDKDLKPNMNLYLEPFVSSLVRVKEKNGIVWKHPKTDVIHVSPVCAPLFVADAPARASVLNMQEHQAKYACNTCEQKTNKLPAPPVVLGQRKQNRKRRFLFKEDPAELRTHQSMSAQGQYAENTSKPKKGLKGCTVIQDLPSVDLSTCVLAEYMHCCLTGIVRQICSLWFFVKGDWFLGDHLTDINAFLCNHIHPPDFVSRLPRSLDYFSYFKANEFRSFLLYYSIIVVAPYLEDKYLQHWMLFVDAVFLLLSQSISEDHLLSAEVMLRLFVRDLGKLYGDDQYVYNIHQLTHLALHVRRWGNLWSNSAFNFESINGTLSRMIHGSKNEGRELLNQFYLAQAAQMLKNKIITDARTANNMKVLGKPLLCVLNDHEETSLTDLNVNIIDLKFYGRISVGREQFSSKQYDKDFKRRNSYVEVKYNGHKKYGRIVVFCHESDGHRILCLISLYKVVHSKFFFHRDSMTRIKHIIPVEDTGGIIACEVKDIEQKLINVGDYLCFRPNSVESNL